MATSSSSPSRSTSQADADTAHPASALRDPTPWFVRFQRLLDEMTSGEKRVGSYFMEHPDAAQKSIGELIDVSGLGYGTVIRFCQKLGCRGFQEFKVLMARDAIAQRPNKPVYGTGAYNLDSGAAERRYQPHSAKPGHQGNRKSGRGAFQGVARGLHWSRQLRSARAQPGLENQTLRHCELVHFRWLCDGGRSLAACEKTRC